MVNVNPSFSYHALHSLLKAYGTVFHIQLVYDKDFPSNRCYVTFLSCDEARLAFEHVASLPLTRCGFKTELLHSRNISDSDMDYIPNVFDNHLENSVPEVRQIPPPRWFVAYYRNGRGNFIHASRYLAKEIGTIPEGNLKKYEGRYWCNILCFISGSIISRVCRSEDICYLLLCWGWWSCSFANRFALSSDESVESSVRCDGNNLDLTKVTYVVDVHFSPVLPKLLKGLTKRHRGSAELIDLAQPKQSKVFPGARDHESSRDRSAMVAPMVSVQPSVMPSVSDRASCDEDGVSMESSDDIVTAVPRGPTVSKSAVQSDPCPPMTGSSDDGSHHSPVG
ncbi:hypothetical protein E2C01_049408 [Portunus trituberculatus]|uniref:RRM domain-containing protein n=1 Tax=Portunus trituberculatus TaxID=210409 RepID=A0A5B7G6B3_PORTR|nr:hypothetical protein [Portunus trituberculatus]